MGDELDEAVRRYLVDPRSARLALVSPLRADDLATFWLRALRAVCPPASVRHLRPLLWPRLLCTGSDLGLPLSF